MRIHSDKITNDDIWNALRKMEGVEAIKWETKGSRSRKRAYEITLSGTSNRNRNPGTSWHNRTEEPEKAATWDEWGIFIHHLFTADPDAIVGRYKSWEHFEDFTGGRFNTLKQEDQHKNHKWEYVAPRKVECSCGAVRDYGI